MSKINTKYKFKNTLILQSNSQFGDRYYNENSVKEIHQQLNNLIKTNDANTLVFLDQNNSISDVVGRITKCNYHQGGLYCDIDIFNTPNGDKLIDFISHDHPTYASIVTEDFVDEVNSSKKTIYKSLNIINKSNYESYKINDKIMKNEKKHSVESGQFFIDEEKGTVVYAQRSKGVMYTAKAKLSGNDEFDKAKGQRIAILRCDLLIRKRDVANVKDFINTIKTVKDQSLCYYGIKGTDKLYDLSLQKAHETLNAHFKKIREIKKELKELTA